jgi:alginate O-acetyltransferase complex protein AlgJ
MPRRARLLFPLAALMLSLPLIATLAGPDAKRVSAEERRTLAQPPRFADGAAWPRAAEAWARDHFGLREPLLHAYGWLVHVLLATGDADVWVGRGLHLYYRGEAMLEQSAGLASDPKGIEATVAMLATMREVLAARGARLIVAVPPNASTIVAEDLPAWARNPGRPTDYDRFLAALAARGITAVDLRPPLSAARAEGAVFRRHDSHWTPRGALAGFNAAAAAAGLSAWRQTARTALWPAVMVRGGDLARLLGIAWAVAEPVEAFRVIPRPPRWLGPPGVGPSVQESGGDGPSLLVIGDSFTDWALAGLLEGRARRFYWMHHRRCDFDWTWVERLRPDQVWFMPAERWFTCAPGRAPAGLAATAAR